RSIYRFNFIAARAESAAFPFVIGRNLVVDDLIAVRQTAAGDHSQHSQLLPVHYVGGANAAGIAVALRIDHEYAAREERIHEALRGNVGIPVVELFGRGFGQPLIRGNVASRDRNSNNAVGKLLGVAPEWLDGWVRNSDIL